MHGKACKKRTVKGPTSSASSSLRQWLEELTRLILSKEEEEREPSALERSVCDYVRRGWRCERCDRTFPSVQEAGRCLGRHGQKRCFLCFLPIPQEKVGEREHMRFLHRNTAFPTYIKCPFCPHTTPNNHALLEEHVLEAHTEEDLLRRLEASVGPKEEKESGRKEKMEENCFVVTAPGGLRLRIPLLVPHGEGSRAEECFSSPSGVGVSEGKEEGVPVSVIRRAGEKDEKDPPVPGPSLPFISTAQPEFQESPPTPSLEEVLLWPQSVAVGSPSPALTPEAIKGERRVSMVQTEVLDPRYDCVTPTPPQQPAGDILAASSLCHKQDVDESNEVEIVGVVMKGGARAREEKKEGYEDYRTPNTTPSPRQLSWEEFQAVFMKQLQEWQTIVRRGGGYANPHHPLLPYPLPFPSHPILQPNHNQPLPRQPHPGYPHNQQQPNHYSPPPQQPYYAHPQCEPPPQPHYSQHHNPPPQQPRRHAQQSEYAGSMLPPPVPVPPTMTQASYLLPSLNLPRGQASAERPRPYAHQQQLPSGEEDKERYQCDQCCKSYASEGWLERHKMRHTGIFPFVCRICRPYKNFILSAPFRQHAHMHDIILTEEQILHILRQQGTDKVIYLDEE